MNLLISVVFLLAGWLESQSLVAAARSTTSSTFYCGQTPCKPPGHCCGKYNAACCTTITSGSNWSPDHCCGKYNAACCTTITSGSNWSPGHCCGKYNAACCTTFTSGSNWYIYLIVGLVVVGVGVGVGVGIYCWRKRGGSLPYFRST